MDRPTDPRSKLYRVSATEITEKGLEFTSKWRILDGKARHERYTMKGTIQVGPAR